MAKKRKIGGPVPFMRDGDGQFRATTPEWVANMAAARDCVNQAKVAAHVDEGPVREPGRPSR